ncbi:protein kinase [Stemphylium lycopersici]|nr:protein kinase [Stemphylium lycopersici]
MVDRANRPSALNAPTATGPGPQVDIVGEGGSQKVVARLPSGESIEVLLFGATVTSWKSNGGQTENLWLSDAADLAGKKPVRGGIPVVFPVFGPPPKEGHATSSLPQHGFARGSRWEFMGKSTAEDALDSNSVKLDFGLDRQSLSEESRKAWPLDFGLVYSVTLSKDSLQAVLTVRNEGEESFEFQFLLHTYFKIQDVSKIAITGLSGTEYIDKVLNASTHTQSDNQLKITGEVDRVYKDIKQDTTSITEDGKPRFDVIRDNVKDTVTWNPWIEKAKAMGDFSPDDGYKNMVCVEIGAVDGWQKLEKGEVWEGGMLVKSHLRHGSAVVVYDQRSKQLSLRGASPTTEIGSTSCPYCHRPYREPSPHDGDDNDEHEHSVPGIPTDNGFVNPAYFQMLRRSQPGSTEGSRPSSPHKQLAPAPMRMNDFHAPEGSEFLGSTPAQPARSQGISARAFSPNYFKDFFVEECELGRGGKGVVLLVQHILDGVQLGKFACKRVPVGDDHEWLEKVLIEVQLLQTLSHQNLVSYRHVWLEDFQISSFGPSVPCAFILQQYCNGGDLHSYILDSAKTSVTKEQMKERLRRRSKGQLEDPENVPGPRKMPFEEIISFFKDITSGLSHLHANGYIHRDLKPSNCLLHRTGHKVRVLVSDFGEVQSASTARNSTGATGTISYCAPEVLRQERPGGAFGNFTTKSDIFSLGMIVYFMCFARLPYRNADGIDEDSEDLDLLRAEISTWAGIDDEQRVRSDLPEKLYRSLKRLLALDPDERPGADEILHVLKSPLVFDDYNAYAGSSGLDEFSPRISRADTPSPSPSQSNKKRSSANYARPGRSKLSATVMDRSPSPELPQPMRRQSSSDDGAVILRRKPDLPPPSSSGGRTPSPQRLMLPPPPPPNAVSRLYRLARNPAAASLTKVALFCAKAFSLLSPLTLTLLSAVLFIPNICRSSVHNLEMQSSPPTSDGKARAIRELSRSLSHSPRNIESPSPPQSDSNPTQHSGFGGTNTSQFWNDSDILHSTQHNIADDTNTLPQYPRIRSTAKKQNTWAPFRSEQLQPDTSMVNKEFQDFDHSISDEESMAVEQARGGNRSNRATPSKMSSQFESLYDMTPATNRSRKSHLADTGSLRRDAAIRRAARNDIDYTASPRPASKRNSPAMPAKGENKRNTLAQLHAKLSEDESSFMEQRPPTLTIDSTKNSRWGNRSRQTSVQLDGNVDTAQTKGTPRSRHNATQNTTAQSFILPDLPNLTELVSGVWDDGTPVFSKTSASRSRFAAPPKGGRRPSYIPVDGAPIPEEEKAIFAALQQLQEKLADMEHERAEAERKIEEQELELIELRATTQAQEKLRRSDSAQDSDAGKNSWKVEKTRLDATVQTLRTKLDRADRKFAVLEIEKKRLSTEKDNMANQLGIAFQTCEELKNEKGTLSSENEELRQEVETLRAENEALRDQLDRDQSQHREETTQLRRQFDQTANATERENANLHAELARVRAQHDENTQQLSRRDSELRRARQEQVEYARLKSDHESLRSQLADLKAKREEDVQRWSRLEATLRTQVDHRDETIRRHFDDTDQERTNEAMRLDNENLRNEIQQLQAQQEEEYEQWARKEAEFQRKIQLRENAARQTRDITRELFNVREMNNQHFDEATGPTSRSASRPGYRREDTRTRIRNRVQQELRNSKVANESQQGSRVEESPRKSFTNHSRFSTRSASAPTQADKQARVESEVESTTDLSLAPRSALRISRNTPATKQTTVQPPADLDLTELSYIDKDQIAQLRRLLEEDRAMMRRNLSSAPVDEPTREDTVRSHRQPREDTARSVASANSERRPSLVRKSSLKDTTQRTTGTQFEEDTGNLSNLDADGEATQTKQSAIEASMISNTSRRRRSAPTEMTSAFIVPDIKFSTSKQATATINAHKPLPKDHDNANCTVCRREGYTTATDTIRAPKLVPASVRTIDDIDATLRPAQSPKEALALVVKGLNDERIHLHAELAVQRAFLEQHDPSLGNRKRIALNNSIQDLLRRIDFLDKQIYRLYDVLEGQQADDLTEEQLDELTGPIRIEEEKTEQQQPLGEKKQGKKVTIRSFHDEDESVEMARGGAGKDDVEDEDDDSTHELPWEGFEDDGMEGDVSFSAMAGWRSSAQ